MDRIQLLKMYMTKKYSKEIKNNSADIVRGDVTQELLEKELMNGFPKVSVSQTEREVKITAEIPGVHPEDVDIDIHDTWMAIGGVIDREKISGSKYEDLHGEFRREFTLPVRVKEKEMKATHHGDVFDITIPKAQ
ncbi:MAG: family molecular chaperone [Candidatus Paceibacter sp.]|jgi:HSP20 family protein|nr:family molecular chaperone [Candidatus Paceibacter sp.]